MFKPGGLFGPKPGKAALEQAVGTGSGSDDNRDAKKGGGDSGGDKTYGGSGFDPRGLERAAKAAKVRGSLESANCCGANAAAISQHRFVSGIYWMCLDVRTWASAVAVPSFACLSVARMLH